MFYFWVCIILGFLVFGEATALLIGMNLSGLKGREWLTLKNYFILILDVISGLLVIAFILVDSDRKYSIILIIILITIFISHLYRTLEYLADFTNKFCDNISLFIFNNIKLLFSITCIIILIFILKEIII